MNIEEIVIPVAENPENMTVFELVQSIGGLEELKRLAKDRLGRVNELVGCMEHGPGVEG
jgi:hypothetical protein